MFKRPKLKENILNNESIATTATTTNTTTTTSSSIVAAQHQQQRKKRIATRRRRRKLNNSCIFVSYMILIGLIILLSKQTLQRLFDQRIKSYQFGHDLIHIYNKNSQKLPEGATIEFPPKLPMLSKPIATTKTIKNLKNTEKNTNLLSQKAYEMCTRTLWHTIESTTIVLDDTNETFIHTGDINDLWIRDSSAQVHPLLVPFLFTSSSSSLTTSLLDDDDKEQNHEPSTLIQNDLRLNNIVSGLIKRLSWYIHHDPYANAFRIDDTYKFSKSQMLLGRHDYISTWNYELDSGCYYIRLLYYYFHATKKQKVITKTKTTTTIREKSINYDRFDEEEDEEIEYEYEYEYYLEDDNVLLLPQISEATEIMITLWELERYHEDDSHIEITDENKYLFENCKFCMKQKPYRYRSLKRAGKGTPTNSSSGLTWTGFRPSDDECEYHYLIPANMFVIIVLQYVIELCTTYNIGWNNCPQLIDRSTNLIKSIQYGIETYGIINHPTYGKMYAYEVDGLGNYVLMDDANVPSLLSMPYLGYPYLDDEIYENTKRFIFSYDNPTYQKSNRPIPSLRLQQNRNNDIPIFNTLSSKNDNNNNNNNNLYLEGYGSRHMKQQIYDNIWPMSLAIQGLISNNITEKIYLVELLTHYVSGQRYWMHESISVNNPKQFTRSWFCWADSLYAELVLSIDPINCPRKEYKYNILEWRSKESSLLREQQRQQKQQRQKQNELLFSSSDSRDEDEDGPYFGGIKKIVTTK